MKTPRSPNGLRLWKLLPAEHRLRDEPSGDLAGFVDAIGGMLDLVRATLDQRYGDNFPDSAEADEWRVACQPWLLPYFARLLDVQLRSPHLDGRREEIANAISWRQWKGSRAAADDIAATFLQSLTALQEGWTRVAVTPRIGHPILPWDSCPSGEPVHPTRPAEHATHPGLPAVTVDFRRRCRAVPAHTGDRTAKQFRFRRGSGTSNRQAYAWNCFHPHGIPTGPGSFDDVSRRTVDIRTGAHARGLYHPRRILVFTTPEVGFFPDDAARHAWSDRRNLPPPLQLIETGPDDGNSCVANAAVGAGGVPPDRIIVFKDSPPAFTSGRHVELSGLSFVDSLTISGPTASLRYVAARRLIVDAADSEAHPALRARDCLFGEVEVVNGSANLEYCTITGATTARNLFASDCIFDGDVRIEPVLDRATACIRFSALPGVRGIPGPAANKPLSGNSPARPVWVGGAAFGDPGTGVLDSLTPDTIRFGAEDGGEMGACHHLHYSLKTAGLQSKLSEFLPFGLSVVIVNDRRLFEAQRRLTHGDPI